MSNVVDSKVVELQFENKDFEKNATQSISTLKELKENLNFTGTTKGLEDINSSIKAVNFSNLTNGIKEATNGFSMMETIAFGVFTRIGEKITDFAANTIGRLFTYVPSRIIQGGFNRATNVDKAEFLLKGMGKDIEEIHEEIEIADKYIKQSDEDAIKAGKSIKTLSADINSAVSGTSFGYDQAAKAAAQLAASNVEIGNDMRATLQGISGVAAMTNASYDEIAYVFTKVAASGKAMNGELRMLSDRGLPVTASIATYINNVLKDSSKYSDDVVSEIKEITNGLEVTEADVVELASKSEISFATFRDAMFEAYSGMAFKANDTYEGVISNIGAQLARIGEIFAGPFREDAIPVLQQVYNIIKKVRDIVANSVFAQAAIAGMKAISDGLVFILSKVDAFLGKVREIQSALGIGDLLKNMFSFGGAEEAAEESAEKISGSFETVRDAAFKVIKGDYGNGMARLQKLTEEGFDAESIQKYVNALWEVSGHDWSKVFDDDIQKQAWNMLGLGKSMEKCAENGQDLAKSQREEQKALRQMTKEMSVSDRVMFGATNVVLGLSTAFSSVKETFKKKVKFPTVEEAADTISTKFALMSAQFNEFSQKHGKDIGEVFAGIGSVVLMVADGFVALGKILGTLFTTALLPIFGLIGSLALGFLKAASSVRTWVTENKALDNIVNQVNAKLTAARTKVEEWWKSFKEIPAVSTALEKFKSAFTTAFTYAPYYLNLTKNAVVRFGKRVKNAFKQLVDKKISPAEFFDQISRAWKSFTATISSFQFVQDLKVAFDSAKVAISDWFKSLGDNEDGSRNWFGKVTDTIGAGVDWITAKFTAGWGKVTGFFEKYKLSDFFSKNFTTIKTGISTFFSNLPGFATGLKTKWTEFMQKVTDLGGFKFENIGQIWQAFKDTIGQYWKSQDIFAPIKTAFEDVKASAKAKLLEMGIDVDAIIETIKGIPEKLKAYFTDEEGNVTLSAGVTKMFDSIKQAFSTGKEGIEGEASSIFDTIIGIPAKIAEFFTDENGNASITAGISNLFNAIVGALTTGKGEIDKEGTSALDTLLSIPNQIVQFFTGWSIPEGFNNLIQLFTDAGDATNDPQLKTNLTSAGAGFKGLCDKFKEGADTIDWNGIGKIASVITTLTFVGGAVLTVNNVRRVVEALTDTFGKKAEARNLTAWAVLKISAAIAIVAVVIDKLREMFKEDPINTANALRATTGIAITLNGLLVISRVTGSGGKLAALTGLGSMLEGIGIAKVAKACDTIQKANVGFDTVIKAGAIGATLTALSMIAGSSAATGPIGLLAAAAGLLVGVDMMLITEAIVNLSEGITTMKDMSAEEAKTAASNFGTAVTTMFDGLAAIKIDPASKQKVEDLSKIVDMINGLGSKTTWMNVLGGIPKIGPIDVLKRLFGGGTAAGSVESNAQQVNTTVEEVAGVFNTWNEKMSEVNLDLDQITAAETLVRTFGQISDFGWANFLFGSEVSDKFVTSMSRLAEGVSSFYTTLNLGASDFDPELAKSAADVVYSLGALDQVTITGAGNFIEVAEQLATGVNTFVGALEKIDDPDTAKTAAELAGSLASLMDFMSMDSLFNNKNLFDALNPQGSAGKTEQAITAYDALDSLTTRITQFVENLSTVEGIDTAVSNVSTIASSVETLSTIKLSEGDIMLPSTIETFTSNVESIIETMSKAALSAFMTSAGINKLKENVETVSSIDLGGSSEKPTSDDGKKAAEEAAKGMGNAKGTFNSEMSKALGGAKDAITKSSSDYTAAGESLMSALASGLKKGAASVATEAGSAASAGASKARKHYSDFRGAGAYLAEGFSQGITNTIFKVRLAAEAMAKAALEKAREVLRVGSPSKEAAEIGKFFDLGFAGGITRYTASVKDATGAMAETARKGLYKATEALNAMITSDFNATPVIKPVLDLSEIQNGASSISSMLNTSPSLALAGNLGAINAATTSRTDPNAGILTALESLKDTITGNPSNTYIIDGVTYDDGSNIASAVETLVHAARLERRV